MKAFLIITIAMIFLVQWDVFAQRYIANKSEVSFYSSAPVEDIEAVNRDSRSVFDAETGKIVFVVKPENFVFANSLMQEHFNENYLEIDKYPESSYSAAIENWENKPGIYKVNVNGKFTLHGVSRDLQTSGTIDYSADNVKITAEFPVELKDYKIKIPKALFYNIAETIQVKLTFEYHKL